MTIIVSSVNENFGVLSSDTSYWLNIGQGVKPINIDDKNNYQAIYTSTFSQNTTNQNNVKQSLLYSHKSKIGVYHQLNMIIAFSGDMQFVEILKNEINMINQINIDETIKSIKKIALVIKINDCPKQNILGVALHYSEKHNQIYRWQFNNVDNFKFHEVTTDHLHQGMPVCDENIEPIIEQYYYSKNKDDIIKIHHAWALNVYSRYKNGDLNHTGFNMGGDLQSFVISKKGISSKISYDLNLLTQN